MSVRRIDFVGRLDQRTELGDGSVRFTARLTRTGVFDYGDHKELRTDAEVFAPEALASFRGLTITEGHQAWVTPENWSRYAIGHVGEDVRQDGPYVVASLTIKDASALAKISKDDLAEISMGYSVDLEAKSGEFEGQKYDAVQTNIRGNHAALGPNNWGRAGADVRILDAAYSEGMSTERRIDAPAATPAVNAELEAEKARADKAEAERDAAVARADKAEAERDAVRAEADKARADAKAAQDKVASEVAARVKLVDAACKVLGSDFDFAGKSDSEIRSAVITKSNPGAKLDGKSEAYLEASFDLAIENVAKERASLAAVNVATVDAGATTEKSRLDEALEKQAQERDAASKSGAPATAAFRK